MGGYLAVALLCAQSAKKRYLESDRELWFAAYIVLIVLGINCKLQVERELILSLREVASAQGWYGQRRTFQWLALGMLLWLGVLSARYVIVRLAWHGRIALNVGVAIAGLTGLVTLFGLRAVSLHHTDQILGTRIGGISAGRGLEILGLLLLALGALSTRSTVLAEWPKGRPHV